LLLAIQVEPLLRLPPDQRDGAPRPRVPRQRVLKAHVRRVLQVVDALLELLVFCAQKESPNGAGHRARAAPARVEGDFEGLRPQLVALLAR
jgi:hypothetical protein